MNKTPYWVAPVLAGATALAVVTAPGAQAAPGQTDQACSNAGAATECTDPGNVQFFAHPQNLPIPVTGYGPLEGLSHGGGAAPH